MYSPLSALRALAWPVALALLLGPAGPAAAQQAALADAAASAAQPAAAYRFARLAEGGAFAGLSSLFNAQDRAAAAATPRLRVAVANAGAPALLSVSSGGDVQGPLVQWLQAVAGTLGLQLSPVLVADEAAQLQALREGRADLALAVATPMAGPAPGLAYSLGTGAQPLAWVVLREQRPVPLERARIAHVTSGPSAEAVTADRLRRHHPGATLMPQDGVEQALQAVVERRADAYLGNLLPVLAVLQRQELQGLELRQVWPGAAGHRHLVVRDDGAALLPALNKALAAWRATHAPHQAVLRAAQQAALQLRAPLALPADLMGADTAVMDRLIKPPYGLPGTAAEREPLAERSTWRVGALRNTTGPVATLSALDAQGRHTGAAADMLQEVALRLGVVVQMQPFDSDAAMVEALRTGTIDAVPLLEHTPQQPPGLMFSLPWLELPQVLVGTDTGPLFWGLESLRGRRLAIAAKHPLRAELQRQYPGIQWVDAADGTAALAQLRQGQADAALDIKPVVQRLLATPAGQGLRVLGDVAEFTARYRVALSEAQRGLMPQLDAALTDIEADERQRSVRRWLVTEPVPARVWWQNPWSMAGLAAVAAAFAALAAWGWWRASRRRAAEPTQDRAELDEHLSSDPTARSEPVLEPPPAAERGRGSAPLQPAPAGGDGRVPRAARRRPASATPVGADAPVVEAPPTRPTAPMSPVPSAARSVRPAKAAPSAQPVRPVMPAHPPEAVLPAAPAEPEEPAVPAQRVLTVEGLQPTKPKPPSEPADEPVHETAAYRAQPSAQTSAPQPSQGRAPANAAPSTQEAASAPQAAPVQAPVPVEPGFSLFERAVAAGLPALPARVGPTATALPAVSENGADEDLAFESIDVEAAWKAVGRVASLGLAADTVARPATAVPDNSHDLHLERLLEQVLVPHHRKAEAQGLRLTWSVDEVLPVRIRSDPGRLTLLVNLLLARALVLAAPLGTQGRVVFKATWARLDDGKPALQLTVNATTMAIANPSAPDVQLAGAADLATVLQGQLTLRQREGVGQAVIVRVPLRGARHNGLGAANTS